jgi:hypothetical protein
MLPFDARGLRRWLERSSAANAERAATIARTTGDRFETFAMLAGGGADAGHEA